MSYFRWLDSSESARRRMLDVIDLFRQQDTVDELGMGGIRDAIAELLSPGTSTIQTRARYFFFLPWMYLEFERKGVTVDKVVDRARTYETNLIAPLAASNDSQGTLGIEAGKGLKRLPSSVYWAGLGRLGFRLFDGPLDSYRKTFDRRLSDSVVADVTADDGAKRSKGNWHPRIPKAPPTFPDEASFELTREEAEYFLDRLRFSANESLLWFLVEHAGSDETSDFSWNHARVPDMPAKLRGWLFHAQCFSEVMHGAALLYNYTLSELRKEDVWVAAYQRQLSEWSARVSAHSDYFVRWRRAEFWFEVHKSNPRIAPLARAFADHWIDIVTKSPQSPDVTKSQAARRLVEDRERRLKRGRSRFESRAHLDLWGGASGTAPYDYRWRITQNIAHDVLKGLGR